LAEESLRDALNRQPDSIPALFLLGQCLIRKDSEAGYREALSCFEQVIGREPDHIDAWANRACLLGHLESIDAMNAAFEQAIGRFGANYCALLLEAWSKALTRFGQTDMAERKHQEALAENPGLETP
jgi:tetratricopeptide (TPR) repeat protein